MAIVVIGLNHRTAPLGVLERVALHGETLVKALHDLRQRPNVGEAVIVATCHRTEVVAAADRYHGAFSDIRDFLCDLADLPPDELHPHLFTYHDDDAVAHLFEVASGLQSAVVGESEILGQVRAAWELAQAEGAARSTLNLLFRRALEAGKRARTETGIGRGTASVSHAAVDMAREHLGTLAGARVVVLGAGEMSAGVAMSLADAGVAEIVIVNRTPERAAALAPRVGARVAGTTALASELAGADVVLASTAADMPIVDRERIAMAMAARPERPMLLVDLAVPRDVDPGVGELPGVSLLDLDDLRRWADRGREARAQETEAVRGLLAEEVERFSDEISARQVAPLIAALRDRAEGVRQGELRRFQSRFAGLSDEQQAAVDTLTQRIVAKVLHDPSVRLKADAGTPRGERNSAALRDLFDLG